MSPVRAWQATLDEAGDVAALLAAFRDHIGGHSPPTADASRRHTPQVRPSDAEMRETVERLIERTDTEFLLAAADDGLPPAGVCQLRYRLSVWTSSPDCWLEDLFVAEPARRAGLGAALVEAALERARAQGCRRIELDTNEENAGALALYHRLGFSERSKGGPGRDLFLGRRLD